MTRASSNLNVQHTEPDWDEITSKRHTTLPTETWALIDSSSNQGLISVPPAYRTNYFVVQAHFPVARKDKVNRGVGLYIMQPWTITELLHGYAV